MKTITLSDEAYERLMGWQEDSKDSLSSIVLRVIPKRRALADMLVSFRQLSPLTNKQAEVMKEELAWANDEKNHRIR